LNGILGLREHRKGDYAVRVAFTALLGVLVLNLMSISLSAQGTSIGFYGIGGRLSYVDPEGDEGTVGIGAHADLGTLFDLLWLYPSIEYWGKSHSEASLNLDQTFTQISINGDVRFMIPVFGGRVLPFLGGGPSVILSVLSKSYYDPYYGQRITQSDADVRFGLEALGGVHVPLGSVAAFVEGKYGWSDMDVWRITAGFTISVGR
jgi:hypothetical protein